MNCVKYAVFAAEQVIDIFEKKYPDDKRPRKAIEVTKKYIENPSAANAEAAYNAYVAAASSVTYAYAAASSVTYVYAAAAASVNVAVAASSVNVAAVTYAAVTYADAAADDEIRIKILNYGLSLIKEKI
jgi:hypothetical protein